ncbi:hypothetical protein PR048_011424 [Dryococelus australis]|uniref:Uncharacterized protein n=1 Tax=Dryococelus australis TaxID=614101 RepID=A0ABQ9HLK2_9NEOP|nr:hypothetical protein PR048_011424 [Dryococelus australis]
MPRNPKRMTAKVSCTEKRLIAALNCNRDGEKIRALEGHACEGKPFSTEFKKRKLVPTYSLLHNLFMASP